MLESPAAASGAAPDANNVDDRVAAGPVAQLDGSAPARPLVLEINGRRCDACLTHAAVHGGDRITTVEGLLPAEMRRAVHHATGRRVRDPSTTLDKPL